MAGAIGALVTSVKAAKAVHVVMDGFKRKHFPPERTLRAFILLCAHKYGEEYYVDKKVTRETLLQKVSDLVDNHLVFFTNYPGPSLDILGYFNDLIDMFKKARDPVLDRLDKKIYKAVEDWLHAKFWNKMTVYYENVPFIVYSWNGNLEDFCGESLSASLTSDERSTLLSLINEDYDPLPHAS